MSGDARATELAGRSEELRAIRAAYRSACEGRTRVLLLDGSLTSGLYELLAHWQREHRAGPVLEVDARRAGALARLAKLALSHLSTVRRARHPAHALLETATARADATVDLTVASERRLRLLEAVRGLLGELGTKNPVVVLLRDAATLDRTTVELLEQVLADANAAPILFVVATRRAPSETLTRLLESEHAERLSLGPLDRVSVRELLGSAEVIDAVLELTGGDPARIAQLLAGRGVQAVAAAPDRCAEEAARALAAVAHPLSEAQLGALIGSSVPCAGLRALGAERSDAGWTLPPSLAQRLRPDAATCERLRGALIEVLAPSEPEVAARFALALGDAGRAQSLVASALTALVARHATVDAADLALDVIAAADAAEITLVPALHARAAELAWAAGARDAAVREARRAAEAGDSNDVLRLGQLLARTGAPQDAIDLLIPLLEDAGGSRLAALRATLAEASYSAGDLEAARSWAERALESADETLALDVQNTLAKVEMAAAESDAARERIERILADAPRVGHMRAACHALNNRAILAMARGELRAARVDLEEALALAHTHGAMFHRAIAEKNLAVVHQLEGRYGPALHHAEAALARLAGLDVPAIAARLAYNLADLHCSLGDVGRARELCVWARHQDPAGVIADEGRLVEAGVEREGGDLRAADALLVRVLESPAATTSQRRAALIARCEVALCQGETAAAAALLQSLPTEGLDARALARRTRLEADRDRLDGGDAVPKARRALEHARATSDPLIISRAWLSLARALSSAGLRDRSAATLAELRAHERALLSEVPPALAEHFQERALVRGAAELERALEQGGPAPLESTGRHAAAQAPASIVGESAPMRALNKLIDRVGQSTGTVLIHGESGTGKELVAEALHHASRRADRPLVRVNCAALVDDLLSSELFGHERGAFTGADRRRQGRFELADGGTIFLDEIGDISPRMQAALLRVLQEGTFERVGGSQTLRCDVRVVAATHRDLAALVAEGRFREDLYYRLSGITLQVPALRERASDIPALARHLLVRMEDELGARTLAPDALTLLASHEWPGNVRELENALRRAALLAPAALLTAADFDLGRVSSAPPPATPTRSLGALAYDQVRGGGGTIYELRKGLERELVERALEDTSGNISRAAELLGMKRPRLSKLVHEWGLKQ